MPGARSFHPGDQVPHERWVGTGALACAQYAQVPDIRSLLPGISVDLLFVSLPIDALPRPDSLETFTESLLSELDEPGDTYMKFDTGTSGSGLVRS